MTDTSAQPDGPAPAAADAAAEEAGVDMWSLAGQPPPEQPRWLLVTAADSEPGGAYTASPVPGPQPRAFGGDVLVCLAPGLAGPAVPGISVSVWTAARGALVPVADWELPGVSFWPERIRATVIFTMSAMAALGERADLGELDPVDLTAAAGDVVPGLPSLAEHGRPMPLP
jgi:hypothetical protein